MTIDRDEVRRRKRLTRAMKNPRLALDKGWAEDPLFCAGLLDRCDQLAMVLFPEVRQLARQAIEAADACGDRHLFHRSHGVLSHAYIVHGELYWAGKTLEDVRERALACCPRCRADHFRRLGDLLGEDGRLDEALSVLGRALEAGGRHLDDDARGRIHYDRGVIHFLRGNRRRALADAASTLELVDLSSPRGLSVDTAAFAPIYVAGGDPEDDAFASAMLAAFDQRIKGERGWGDWITRRTWADAHLQARQGNFSRALTLMKRAYIRLLADGLPREAVAVTLDLGQLRCRRPFLPWGGNWQVAIEVLERCRDQRSDLPEVHREGLKELLGVLADHPESAFDQLVELRRSFIAPVPGVMVERIDRRSKWD